MQRTSNPGMLAISAAVGLAIILILMSALNVPYFNDGLGYKLAGVALLVAALIYVFYARANNVEKTGYGALIFIVAVALIIPALTITQQQQQVGATATQYNLTLQNGAALYGQYCASCHGFLGQGLVGPQLNNSATVNKFTTDDLTRIISAGIPADPSDPTKLAMPAWSNAYGGSLTEDDINYLVALIQSSNPAYRSQNNLENVNGFTYVLQSLTNPTQIAEYHQEQKGGSKPPANTFVDLTNQKTVKIDAINSTTGFPYGWQVAGTQGTTNITIKAGTVVTWDNISATVHNVYQGTGPSNTTNKFPPSSVITPNVASTDYTYTFTTPGEYPFYCAIHPAMIGWITVVA